MRFIARFARDKAGSNALEYGLIVALVSLAIVTGATVAGTNLGTMFMTIGTYIAGIPLPAL